jgi:hypothetical protein
LVKPDRKDDDIAENLAHDTVKVSLRL